MEDYSEKERLIINLLSESPSLTNAKLADELGVSPVMVRHYLDSLVEKGALHRVRGGASLSQHPDIIARQKSMIDQKKAIAKAAARMVNDGNSVMIEAGTTTALTAKYLLGRRNVLVVTNSSLVLPYARINPGLALTILGGVFQTRTESFVGPIALAELERFHADIAFVGTDGWSVSEGFTTHHVEGAEVLKKMSERSGRTVMLADSSKFGKPGFCRTLPLERVDLLITDSGLPKDVVSELDGLGKKYLFADRED
jgi:DeoR family galactitol utilization operon repressor